MDIYFNIIFYSIIILICMSISFQNKNAYKRFVTELDNERITKSLQETEDWLCEDCDDECDEQIYTGKLEDLKKVCRK